MKSRRYSKKWKGALHFAQWCDRTGIAPGRAVDLLVTAEYFVRAEFRSIDDPDNKALWAKRVGLKKELDAMAKALGYKFGGGLLGHAYLAGKGRWPTKYYLPSQTCEWLEP